MFEQISQSAPIYTPSRKRPFVAERSEESMVSSVVRLGFWSALLTGVFSLLFTFGLILGTGNLLPLPWDIVIPVGASLLLAPSFVVMMVSVHYAAPAEKKIWSHLGIAFAVIYAALASIVYVTWLFVIEPHVLRGEANQVALLTFTPGSFLQMIDGLGYTFMGVATLFAAPVFAGKRLEKWIRWLCLLNGPGAVMVFLSYVSYGILGLPLLYGLLLGVWWSFLIPALAISLAVYFRRAGT